LRREITIYRPGGVVSFVRWDCKSNMLTPPGQRQLERKVHIWNEKKFWFKVGILLCADRFSDALPEQELLYSEITAIKKLLAN